MNEQQAVIICSRVGHGQPKVHSLQQRCFLCTNLVWVSEALWNTLSALHGGLQAICGECVEAHPPPPTAEFAVPEVQEIEMGKLGYTPEQIQRAYQRMKEELCGSDEA